MYNPLLALFVWFIFVLVVLMVALVQNGIESGRRFSLWNLLLFTTLIALMLTLFVTMARIAQLAQ